jgi:hypothetical protein
MKLLTIGHSNHSLERFVQLLEGAGVATLVDVRTAPASRFNPHFNQGSLDPALARRLLTYVFAGRYLGGRPPDPGCYKHRVLPPEGTDLTWNAYCESLRGPHCEPPAIAARLTQILKTRPVYLRIGLSRKWVKNPGRCYLQLNGIYTFPDYLDGHTFADLRPPRA